VTGISARKEEREPKERSSYLVFPPYTNLTVALRQGRSANSGAESVAWEGRGKGTGREGGGERGGKDEDERGRDVALRIPDLLRDERS